MPTERRKAFIIVIAVVTITAYSLSLIHENPFVTSSFTQNVTLKPVLFEINGNVLSSVLGNWTLIGTMQREYSGRYIEVSTTLESKAIKTVDGREVLVDGLLGVKVRSKSSSVEVTRVTVDMLAGKNVWLGDFLPDEYTGFVYFKATEGPYAVKPFCPGTDPNKEACMEAVLQRYNWGGKLVFYTWPDFNVDGNPPHYSGNVTFRVIIEYLVRKGTFTAEKMKTTVKIPVELRFRGMNSDR